MQTSKWGPGMHTVLFSIAAGYERNETRATLKRQQYKNFFKSIGYVLPCVFCRTSYDQFFEELNIDSYMHQKHGLVRFYYDMRQRINEKLIHQEEKKLFDTFYDLQSSISSSLSTTSSSNSSLTFWQAFRQKARAICYTKPAPPYKKVVSSVTHLQCTDVEDDLHKSIFYIAAGFDLNNTDDVVKRKQYKDFFVSLGETLPCKNCRGNYQQAFEQLDIEEYMSETCGLVRFYYELRELIKQNHIFEEEKELSRSFAELSKRMKPQTRQFWEIFRGRSHQICYTSPSPPYEQVVDDLMNHRASCDTSMKTCRAPAKK